MRVAFAAALVLPALLAAQPTPACAGGGPLGIDHRWHEEDSGIWKRSNQSALQALGIAGTASIALWEGADSRLGRTAWQSVDSTVLSAVAGNGLKPVFGRVRPRDTDSPNEWFKGGHGSFPSGEVSTITGVVTPYVLEYRHDDPWVYALEVLPAYDAIARMKVQAHWQTDVLAGFAIGSASGYLAHERHAPVIVNVLPGGFSIGLKKRF